MKNKKILYISPVGMQFERINRGSIATVKVVNKKANDCIMATYRFKNIEEYKHQFLSWQNLDCCAGWKFDEYYMENIGIQQDKKIMATWYRCGDSEKKIDQDFYNSMEENELIIKKIYSFKRHNNYCTEYIVCKNNLPLSKFFTLGEIIEHYTKLGIKTNKEELERAFEIPVLQLITGVDVKEITYECSVTTKYIIIGLALGYPLESTASIITMFN